MDHELRLFFSAEQYIMPKKQTQRGCAAKKQRKSKKNIRTQRGGDMHKMYNYNNLVQDPQRMMTTSQSPAMKIGGKRHSRKYYKRGGSNMGYSAFNNVAAQMTSKFTNMTNMFPSTATQPVAMA